MKETIYNSISGKLSKLIYLKLIAANSDITAIEVSKMYYKLLKSFNETDISSNSESQKRISDRAIRSLLENNLITFSESRILPSGKYQSRVGHGLGRNTRGFYQITTSGKRELADAIDSLQNYFDNIQNFLRK